MDEESLQRYGWSLERFVERVERLGADVLQYRNKTGDKSFISGRLEELTALFHGRVIVNDYPELAYLCGGVHVGQEDLLRFAKSAEESVAILRNMLPEGGWIGLSTHNEEEILRANGLDLDYIGLGACRATGTKRDAEVLGMERVSRLAALSTHPVAAIGGLRLDDEIENALYRVVGSAIYED